MAWLNCNVSLKSHHFISTTKSALLDSGLKQRAERHVEFVSSQKHHVDPVQCNRFHGPGYDSLRALREKHSRF